MVDVFSTGMAKLDQALAGGFHAGALSVIAGPPRSLRTSLAARFAVHNAVTQRRAGVYFELSRFGDELAYRVAAWLAGIDLNRLRRRMLQDFELRALFGSLDRINKSPLYISTGMSMTLVQITTQSHLARAKHGMEFLVVDGADGVCLPFAKRAEALTVVAQGLRAFAEGFSMPVLLVCPERETVGSDAWGELCACAGSVVAAASPVKRANGLAVPLTIEKHAESAAGHVWLEFS